MAGMTKAISGDTPSRRTSDFSRIFSHHSCAVLDQCKDSLSIDNNLSGFDHALLGRELYEQAYLTVRATVKGSGHR